MSQWVIYRATEIFSAAHWTETPLLEISQPRQQFILSLINLFLVSEYFFQIRVVDAPCLMQMLGDLIDISIGTAKISSA